MWNSPKTNISYTLICKRKCVNQGIRPSFSEDFAYVLNEWSLKGYNKTLFKYISAVNQKEHATLKCLTTLLLGR